MNAELLSAKDKGRTEKGAAATGLARLIVVVAMLTFGALTAQAVTPKLTVAGSLTLLENLTTNALTNLTITVSDADTNVALSNLTLTASSSNTNLVADSGLVLSGSGASWTLTITPMQYAFGTAKISLVASDSQPASTTTFPRWTPRPA